ncbi:acyl-CoA dehydrogenase family protein [Gallaecimonas sp. GXIMD4217]|uniref:acyl-CoA dehydrogenase family protein n=1 Tax=Gallaecimonas sp. GXIMD4217 TaxID=3131927 RepID=UPI00311AEE45
MNDLLSPSILRLRATAAEVTQAVIGPQSAHVDREASWPARSMQVLADADLMGLHVPKRLGGHEQGLLALAVLGETLARGCASTALCYAMHCVGSAVIAAKATPHHEEHYLRPIAENRHITTLALSESGTGAHFYLPRTGLARDGDRFRVSGTKQFVTNGGHADSYVISTQASMAEAEPGDFSCLVVDADTQGIRWRDPWRGFGMRGNSSRAMAMEDIRVPSANLLGREGDQIWYVFEVVAPYFLIAMAGSYVGLAQSALDLTLCHLQNRHYQHSGESLADVSVLQHRVAEMSLAVTKARGLLYRAAYLGDIGDPGATAEIMLAKADAADTVVRVANEAMTCCGGAAYRDNSELARILRDARASHVMAPTTDILKTWAGRLLLGQPLL